MRTGQGRSRTSRLLILILPLLNWLGSDNKYVTLCLIALWMACRATSSPPSGNEVACGADLYVKLSRALLSPRACIVRISSGAMTNPWTLSIQPNNPEVSEQLGANGFRISWESFQKTLKLLSFQNAYKWNGNFREDCSKFSAKTS